MKGSSSSHKNFRMEIICIYKAKTYQLPHICNLSGCFRSLDEYI